MPDTTSPSADVELQWSAPVHPAHERTARWYAIGGGIVFAVAALSLLSGAWSVALVAVLSGAMYYFVRSHVFPDATMTITKSGAVLNGTQLPWSETEGFWVMVTPAYNELHIVPSNPRKKELVIQTGTQDPLVLRETLQRHIPELLNKRERFIDAFIRICKL